MEMVITSLLVLVAMAAVLRELRNGFYLLHMTVVVGLSWLLQQGGDVHIVDVFSHKALSVFLVLHLVSINIITYMAYAVDKRAAARKAWRVPERVLHAFSLIGGTPAAAFARHSLRHKTRKQTFTTKFWVILVLQVVLLLYLVFGYTAF